MKKKLLLGLIFAAALLVAAAITLALCSDSLFRVPATDTYTFINPDEASAPTDTGMTVDGVFDEAVYKENTWTYLHNANGGNTVDIAMTSWFGERGIYFAYEVRENTPIYVNMDRASWMNSCIEMYLVPSDVLKMPSENIFEIDLLPNGYLLFKRPNAAGGWSDVSTTHDKMAFLGAKPFGGEVNTDACTGYDLELFIPYDYLEYLGIDSQVVKNGYVNVNPCHITSYNETGTDGSVDRFWYSFGKQLGGDGWNDVNRYYKFNEKGAMGTVENVLEQSENCTLTGKPTAIPGQNTTVTIIPKDGYALSSILCNGEELIRQVDYREDGSVVLTLPADNDGMRFSAKAELVTSGNKTLKGTVAVKNIFGDTLEGLSASYSDASGEHKLEVNADGSFCLADVPQGYYVIRVKKDGYVKTERSFCLNRDMEVAVDVQYDLFETESGNCWNIQKANDGILTKINGTGAILTKQPVKDFYSQVNLQYSQMLSKEFVGDDYQQQRMGIRVKFDNGKYWHIDLLRENNGQYILQYGKILGKDSLYNWDVVHELTPEQIARYESNSGIALGVLRVGRNAYVYLDNVFIAQADLGAQAGCKAQVGFESFVSNAKVMTLPYQLDVTAPAAVQLVDAGSQGATVSLIDSCRVGQDAAVLIRTNGASDEQLLSVLVNGEEMVLNAAECKGGYRLVIPQNKEKVLSVKAVYAKPAQITTVIDLMDANADGINVRLVQNASVCATSVSNNGKAVFSNVNQGVYDLQASIFGVWTSVERVTVLDTQESKADIKALFETPQLTNYTGNITFAGKTTKHYSIATDITGDAWLTMKLQLNKDKLEAVQANRGNIRLGYRMFFGGYTGNYEWDNEYEITLKYDANGIWLLEQMNTWQNRVLSSEMLDALTADGLHLALHRDADTGILTLYYGSTWEQMLSGKNLWILDGAAEKQKENIMRFGVGFWSENGSDYAATVTDLQFVEDLQLQLPQKAEVTLQLQGHKAGEYISLPQGTQIILSGLDNEVSCTVDENSAVSVQLDPGPYEVMTEGYLSAQLLVSESGFSGQMTLEYERFVHPTGWDTDQADLSGMNNETPWVGMLPIASGDLLEGKFVSILGDSISTYQGISNSGSPNTNTYGYSVWYNGDWPNVLESAEQTYWGKNLKQFGMTLLVNNACGGNKLLETSGAGVSAPAGYIRAEQLAANTGALIGTKPDLIILAMGTNDYIAGIPAGTPDYSIGTNHTPKSFAEGYIVTLKKMAKLYPDAKVLCLTLIPSHYNTNFALLDAYNNVIRQVVAQYDHAVLVDVAANSGITVNNYQNYTFDGTHPNKQGMELMAKVLEDVLQNMANPNLDRTGTMNVLTTDSYDKVAVSLTVKEENSCHSAHTQGIWLRFADGKYMILYQEDAKIGYMKQLWDFETVSNQHRWICEQLPDSTLNKWKIDGYTLQLLRDGNQLMTLADGRLYDTFYLPAQYAQQSVQVGFFGYDCVPGAKWEFAISGDIPEITPPASAQIRANVSVENGTALRLLQAGQVKATGAFADNCVEFSDLESGTYDVQVRAFGYWALAGSVTLDQGATAQLDLAVLFENSQFVDFDGNLSFTGSVTKHCSVATDIAGDAWFAMKAQVDKQTLLANSANGNNVRLGYRLFFGGESGNYLWENEYEITLKYTGTGWIVEQMNTWEGWDRNVSDAFINALTGDGLYLLLHRNSATGVITLYYGTTKEELLSMQYSFQYTQGAWKHTDNIMRFGAGFWAENGASYEANVSGLRYGVTAQEATNQLS